MSIGSQPPAASKRLFWTLSALCLLHAAPHLWAQQLRFAKPVSSIQLLGGRLGVITVEVLDADGNLATNSSALITLTVTGPANYSSTETNSTANGVATFDLSAIAL